ncbi:proline--tRNA ligase, partial [Staphylococcus nepalensis]
VVYEPKAHDEALLELEKVETPNAHTAQEVADVLNRPLDQITKSMVFKVDGEFVIVLVRGHHEVNDVKLKAYFGTDNIELASQDEIINLVGANPGSIGPIQEKGIKVYADNFVQEIPNIVVGANEDGYHYVNANPERDFNVEAFGDFRVILEGEPLSDGSGEAKFAEGIEVGQVFKLGTKYSESMNATFLDNQGKAQPLIMGC